MLNIEALSTMLDKEEEIVFEYNETIVRIWETDQGDSNIRGEEHMNYMYSLYTKEEFEREDYLEYDGGLCTGTPNDAIEMAIAQI